MVHALYVVVADLAVTFRARFVNIRGRFRVVVWLYLCEAVARKMCALLEQVTAFVHVPCLHGYPFNFDRKYIKDFICIRNVSGIPK